MKPVLYLSVGYEDYKALETVCKNFEEFESTHTNVPETFYHKSIRLPLGDFTIEVHAPLVFAGRSEDDGEEGA